jgi:hypothetical protein
MGEVADLAQEKKSSKLLRSMKLFVAWRVRGHALPAWFTCGSTPA